MDNFEAGGLILWFNHKHLIVTYNVVDSGLHFGKKQRWVRHYLQRAQSGGRERNI